MSSVTITGKLLNPVSLEPIRGSITIKATSFGRNSSSDSLYGNANFTVIPDVDTGDFTFDVAAVDEGGVDPTDFAYEVTVRAVNGGILKTFLFQVFEADAPGPVALADLTPAVLDSPIYASYATTSELNALTTVVSGKQPLDADLTAMAALDSSTAGAIASDGAGWIKKTYAQFKTALGLVAADVGLGNVDNTSDANKPISTATQSALDTKVTLPVIADATIFVSPRGNDSNDGLSVKSAKLTLSGAVTALAGGPGRIILGAGTISTGGAINLHGMTGVEIVGMNTISAGGAPGTTLTHNVTGASPAIDLSNSIGCRVSGFYFVNLNAGFTGAMLDLHTTSGLASTLWSIHDMTIDTGTPAAGIGIHLSGAQNGSIRDCDIIRCDIGIKGRNSSSDLTNVITVASCRFGSNTTASIKNIGEGWHIVGNNFEGLAGGGAGAIVNDTSVTVKGVEITGNWFGDVTAGVGGTQIQIGGSGFAITGNMIGINTTAKCVDVAASSSGFVIRGNYLTGGGTGDTGINLGATCSSYDCSGNTYNNIATKFAGGPEVSLIPAVASGSTYIWNTTAGGTMMSLNTSNGRVGILTSNPTSGFHINASLAILYSTISGATTLGASHAIVGASAASPYSVTLPTAVGITGRIYRIIKTDNNANLITIATTSSQTINGATTYTGLSAQYKYIEVISDGANWLIIASN